MGREIINLISSSPPPASRRDKPASSFATCAPTTNTKTTFDHSLDLELEFLDDFDSNDDFEFGVATTSKEVNETAVRRTEPHRTPGGTDVVDDDLESPFGREAPVLAEAAGNKRRRVSNSPEGSDFGVSGQKSSNGSVSKYKAAAVGGSGLPSPGIRKQKTHPAPESSDPFNSSPPVEPKARSQISRPTVEIPLEPPLLAASTSRVCDQTESQTHRARKTAVPAYPISSDPFASSPRLPTRNEIQAGRRHFPDIEISSPVARPAPTHTSRQAWDPISSSAPEATTHTTDRNKQTTSAADIIQIDSSPVNGSDDDLPDLDNLHRLPPPARPPLRRSHSDLNHSSKRSTTRGTRNRETTTTAAEKEAEKERRRQERQAAKDSKMREKERAAALAEVNKMRTDKKVSTPEMIVDLPSGLGSSVKAQVETLLEGLSVEYRTWDSVSSHNIVKWRRKVASRFNEDAGHWEPIPRRIMDENHVAVILTADDFVSLALRGGVGVHVGKVREQFSRHHIVYLLEGLTPWMRKNRNLRNRQFSAGVRSQEAASSAGGRRRNEPATEVISEDVVEDALLELQVMHGVLIHHTAIPLETAQWLAVLTQHISTIPYKKQKDHATLGAGFCMDSGQVRTGEDTMDTYVRMLQEIARVTAPIAYGVASEFGSVTKLVNGLEREGPGRLEAVRKTVNREGALSDRTVGQAVSKRMHKVFTGRDESSTDV